MASKSHNGIMSRNARAEPERRGRKPQTTLTMAEAETENYLTLIRGYCMDGFTNQEIADRLGISERTFYRWMDASDLIRDATLITKEVADYKVENALFKAALAGNVTAIAIWLNNRRPDKWRQHQRDYVADTGMTGVIEIPAVVDEGETDE